jgi:putative oxygen-independent coproporphyrinogen III oxidase
MIRGIYIHIPFCRRKCFYCDFPVAVVGNKRENVISKSQEYTQHLLKEIQFTVEELKQTGVKACIDTIYFGGGTPSLLENECNYTSFFRLLVCSHKLLGLEKILKTISNLIPTSTTPEITLEMDPGTFTSERLKLIKSFGVNRLSVGVQSFNDEILKKCGRSHNSADVYKSIQAIHDADMPNFSLDLISSLPNVGFGLWQETLQEAVKMQPKHISVYDLIVEEKTPFAKWFQPGIAPLPNEDDSRQMYVTAVETLTKQAGFEHYEISNYAQPGYRSKHNQMYWKCEPFLAFGMGAASFLGGKRFSRPKTLKEYYSWVNEIEANPPLLKDILGLREKSLPPDFLEILMLALRTSDGLELDKLNHLFGNDLVKALEASVDQYKNDNIVHITSDRKVKLVDPDGFIISNAVISSLYASCVK